jgi:hypothetical protein
VIPYLKKKKKKKEESLETLEASNQNKTNTNDKIKQHGINKHLGIKPKHVCEVNMAHGVWNLCSNGSQTMLCVFSFPMYFFLFSYIHSYFTMALVCWTA